MLINICYVQCDNCNKSDLSGLAFHEENEARNMARKKGFVREGGRDYCSQKCLDNYINRTTTIIPPNTNILEYFEIAGIQLEKGINGYNQTYFHLSDDCEHSLGSENDGCGWVNIYFIGKTKEEVLPAIAERFSKKYFTWKPVGKDRKTFYCEKIVV